MTWTSTFLIFICALNKVQKTIIVYSIALKHTLELYTPECSVSPRHILPLCSVGKIAKTATLPRIVLPRPQTGDTLIHFLHGENKLWIFWTRITRSGPAISEMWLCGVQNCRQTIIIAVVWRILHTNSRGLIEKFNCRERIRSFMPLIW